jgi:hypothetical protein
MAHVTLCFPDRATAVAAAQALGFWEPPQPIYEWVPTGEFQTIYHYVDEDDGSPHTYDYLPTPEEVAEEGIIPADPFTTQEPVLIQTQTGMTEGRLKTDGQTIREDGTAFSWGIDEIGLAVDTPAVVDPETGEVLEPPVFLPGYYVNATGELPEAVSAYLVPYGSGGRVFAGTEPEDG